MQAIRLPSNPIISPDTPGYDVERLGTNINGPSLIRVPDWLPDPLGRYYLYFAHHQGSHIRLAYADTLEGPWRIHEPGTLHLEQTPCTGHIASPDVLVDHEARQLRMYYHGPTPGVPADEPLTLRWPMLGKQRSHVAVSSDGLGFEHVTGPFAPSYARVFEHGGWWYSISMPFVCHRSPDGFNDWELGDAHLDYRVRHGAVRVAGSTLEYYFSRREDCPEHILMTRLDLSRPWDDWRPSEPVSVLKPEAPWEGADQPLVASRSGAVHEPVHQLRDPAIHQEGERVYLLYSVAGESGIAIAELR